MKSPTFLETLRERRRAQAQIHSMFLIQRDRVLAERRYEDSKKEADRRTEDWIMQRQLDEQLRGLP